jgi:hypothetical protein
LGQKGKYVDMNADYKLELQTLELAAEKLLEQIATSVHDPSVSNVLELEKIAERAAKIAFGCDRADALTEQMHNLIRWTDHLDDAGMRQRFTSALRNRPLDSPW